MSASNPSDAPYVLSDLDEVGVLTLTLNRPDRLNAWIPPMQKALFDAMDAATEDPNVRVIVLTGAGRGFCPGVDMQYLASLAEGSQSPSGTVADTRPITYALTVPKPIVCAINGACAGIGLAVAMSCDIRFAAAEAKLHDRIRKARPGRRTRIVVDVAAGVRIRDGTGAPAHRPPVHRRGGSRPRCRARRAAARRASAPHPNLRPRARHAIVPGIVRRDEMAAGPYTVPNRRRCPARRERSHEPDHAGSRLRRRRHCVHRPSRSVFRAVRPRDRRRISARWGRM